MPVFLDVESRLAPDFVEKITDGIKAGFRQALIEIGEDLSLTDDERQALANYRALKARQLAAAKQHVARTAGIGIEARIEPGDRA
jgi:hypothetical protein